MLSFVHYPEFVYLIEHQFFVISPFKLVNQMADLVLMVVDEEGHAHSTCLHWEGFPSILWCVLSTAGYPNPPLYVGQEFMAMGIRRCHVHMTIPEHPLNPTWLAIETEVAGHHLIDSWEAAAMNALTTFCEQHPLEVILCNTLIFKLGTQVNFARSYSRSIRFLFKLF
jgi:hypothetical protein